MYKHSLCTLLLSLLRYRLVLCCAFRDRTTNTQVMILCCASDRGERKAGLTTNTKVHKNLEQNHEVNKSQQNHNMLGVKDLERTQIEMRKNDPLDLEEESTTSIERGIETDQKCQDALENHKYITRLDVDTFTPERRVPQAMSEYSNNSHRSLSPDANRNTPERSVSEATSTDCSDSREPLATRLSMVFQAPEAEIVTSQEPKHSGLKDDEKKGDQSADSQHYYAQKRNHQKHNDQKYNDMQKNSDRRNNDQIDNELKNTVKVDRTDSNALVCPNGHKLNSHISDYDWVCDRCHNRYARGTTVLTCDTYENDPCDYDACQKCCHGIEPYGESPPHLRCPNGHALSAHMSEYEWQCNRCKRRQRIGTLVHTCQPDDNDPCDYDVCDSCCMAEPSKYDYPSLTPHSQDENGHYYEF